jgi:Uma2 family endonuclease
MNAMAKVAQRMTADEYLAAPDDGRRTWLVDGEVVLNQPANLHQVVLLDVIAALLAWESAAPDRGRVSLPLDVKLNEYNVFGPDVMWYAEGRVPELHDPRPYPLPDLAVASEVMVFRRSAPKSPTFDVSLELGVEDELASPRLPGFALALSSLFAG